MFQWQALLPGNEFATSRGAEQGHRERLVSTRPPFLFHTAIHRAASIFHPVLPGMQISPLLFILGFQIYGNLGIWREMPGPQRLPICLPPPNDSLPSLA